ncbi:hypothetical protein TRICI_006682 [Trichomonascus ciferrii]|uniref:Mediator of RNA polymerase II transcription subunit 14 n=1 Tax=Trichomonascus ciferrii TaxID=44093 RepID=A0A642UH93_9ASCO|nr:hypothetical protein TRICI_006682 [Trichomonascus ciferrii]
MSTAVNEGQSENSLDVKKQQVQQQINDQPQPEIPHITANYVSLYHVTSNLVLNSYAGLQNVIETLPSVTSDLARKRRVLDYLVRTRQEFVKLYVLIKWSTVSEEVSKCIDAVSWLSGQQNCFANVINVLFGIERTLGEAKLRNPDIETALEVLKDGKPLQPAHDFIPPKPLSPKTVLKTLQDLNVLLSIRLALTEQLPTRYRNYEISNGRVKFTVDNCFVVDLGVADDSVEARFFLVDFEFAFPSARTVPMELKAKIENITNDLLAQKPLGQVFDWILRFTQNYKLSVFHEQLSDLERGLWSGVLNHIFYPDKSLIAVQYWINRPGPRNIIEIGFLKDFTIGIRWLREGKPIHDHGVEFGQKNLSIEELLTRIINMHIRYIIDSVYSNLVTLFYGEEGTPLKENEGSSNNPLVSQIATDKIRIQLTGSRHTIFSIDMLTGRAVLQNSTQIVLSAEQSLNELTDKANQSANLLFKLRHVSLQEEITSRAKATGWVANSNIAVSNDDMRKYFPSDTRTVFCLRLPQWTVKWFLLVSIGGKRMIPQWWLSQLEAKGNAWTINFLEPIKLDRGGSNEYVYDYKLFDDLAAFTTTRIRINIICGELQARKIKYGLLQTSDRGGSPTILIHLDTLTKNTWAHSSLLLSLTKDDTQPQSQLKILVQGRVKNQLSMSLASSGDSGVSFDSSTGRFSMILDFSDNNTKEYVSVADIIVKRLSQVEQVVGYIDLIKSKNLELKDASMNEISFGYENGLSAKVIFGTSTGCKLELSKNNPHREVQSYLQEILFQEGLIPVIGVLTSTLSVYQALGQLKQECQKMGTEVLIVPRSVTEIRLIFKKHNVHVELKMVKSRRRQLMVFISDVVDSLPVSAGFKKQLEQNGNGNTTPSQHLKPLWENKQDDLPGTVPLVTGMACPMDQVAYVLQRVHHSLTRAN